MSYHNYTLDELGSRLQSEPDHIIFIDMAKEFIQKFYDGDYISPDDLEAKMDEARWEGLQQAQTSCRNEMTEYLNASSTHIDGDDLENLLSVARTLG